MEVELGEMDHKEDDQRQNHLVWSLRETVSPGSAGHGQLAQFAVPGERVDKMSQDNSEHNRPVGCDHETPQQETLRYQHCYQIGHVGHIGLVYIFAEMLWLPGGATGDGYIE